MNQETILPMEEIKNGVKAFYAKNQADWRQWLVENHEKKVSVWLIIYKKDASANSLAHSNAVDEPFVMVGLIV